jgi:hypothetical protein
MGENKSINLKPCNKGYTANQSIETRISVPKEGGNRITEGYNPFMSTQTRNTEQPQGKPLPSKTKQE